MLPSPSTARVNHIVQLLWPTSHKSSYDCVAHNAHESAAVTLYTFFSIGTAVCTFIIIKFCSKFCFSCHNYSFEYISPKFSNRYQTSWYRVSIWLFCIFFLFHGLHFAVTLRVLKPVSCSYMTSFHDAPKDLRDAEPSCRYHLSIFSVNIAQRVTSG